MFALMELYGADLSDIVHKPVRKPVSNSLCIFGDNDKDRELSSNILGYSMGDNIIDIHITNINENRKKCVERMQKILNYYSNSSEKGIAG